MALTNLEEAQRQERIREIKRLRRDCAELYQVIGTMAEHCPDPHAPQIVKALDNASAAAAGEKRRHDDLLPFVLGIIYLTPFPKKRRICVSGRE